MNKNLYNTLLTLASLMCISLMIYIVAYSDCHYTKTMTVFEVNDNVITFEDVKGNLFDYGLSFEEKINFDFENESQYSVTFYTNMTDDYIYDDVIQKIKRTK